MTLEQNFHYKSEEHAYRRRADCKYLSEKIILSKMHFFQNQSVLQKCIGLASKVQDGVSKVRGRAASTE